MGPTDQQAELAELRAKLATSERQRDEALAALRPLSDRAVPLEESEHAESN